MKKKSVKLVSSVVVLAVLCGAYAGVKTYVAKQEKEESSEEDSKTDVLAIALDDIKSLEFIIDKENTTFEKESDNWVDKNDAGFPVNQSTMDTTAEALKDVKADRVLNDVEDLSEYGLDSPANTITVKTDDTTTRICVGDENTSTSQYYITKDDDDKTVYVVAADSISPFMKSLYDYAESETFPGIDTSAIKKVQVEGKKSYTLEEDSDSSTWNVTFGDDTEEADSSAAGTVTSTFGSMAFDEFVNYNAEDLSQYGLDKPYATVTVDYTEEVESEDSSDSSDDAEAEDSESSTADTISADSSDESDTSDTDSSDEKKTETVEKQLVLYVGDETDSDSRYVTTDNKEVYTMSNDTLNSVIDKEASDLWSLIVSYLSVNNLDQLQVTYNGETNTVNVSRETSTDDDGNDKETVTYKLNGEELDDSKSVFTIFYNKLTNMAAQKRLTEEYTPSTDPEMTATFTDTDGKEMTVSYYAYDTNYYAAVVDSKVFLVNKMNVKEMFSAYQAMAGNNETESDTSESQDTSDTEEAEATETPSVTESAEEE